MKNIRLLALGLLLLTACSSEAPLPPAKPLSVAQPQLVTIPNLERGPFEVLRGEPVDWQLEQRSLRLRVIQPKGDGPYPLVLFSHGNWSDITKYDNLLEHWASHGYIVVAPYHLDGGGMMRGIYNSLRLGNADLIAARVGDLKFLLDHLTQLDAVVPGLSKKIDASRIAAAGHSFGAFSAQQMGGAATVDPKTGARGEGRDVRVRAVLAISPPGPMFGLINDQSWLAVDTPMLVTTGTWDVNAHFWPDWHSHALSYETAKPGSNWLLVVEGADHYLGNLICRPERKAAPQTDALHMVNAMSVTFFDAHLKDDPVAKAFLDAHPLSGLTGGFATLDHR